ncbi:domain found in IF2B/IF5-domain-containing protein [Entophlyctis helioformis]|nr:domain found in IF2B/IF5-domain-containing protein [Entophlyctis helioformis]
MSSKKSKKTAPVVADDVAEQPAETHEQEPQPQSQIEEDTAALFADLKKKKKKSSKKAAAAADDEPAADQSAAVDETPVAAAGADDADDAEDAAAAFADLKKKKKKAKKADVEAEAEAEAEAAPAPADDGDNAEDVAEVFSGLKKKKKSKPAEDGDAQDAEDAAPAEEDAEESLEAAFGEKKKKKKKKVRVEDAEEGAEGGLDGIEGLDGAGEGAGAGADGEDGQEGWLGSNRDYTYSELVRRVFQLVRQNNPELQGEGKKKFNIVAPQILREGSKKTLFANLVDFCRRLRRTPDHLVQFLFAELGTTGSIDGAQRLLIKGRFQQKQIENVLKRYIVEYVTCKTCKSAETVLKKENRLFFLQCESCGSSRSVSAIKTGFVAQTQKRSVARAAAG